MKKTISILLLLGMMSGVLAGCSGGSGGAGAPAFDVKKDISVVSREDGSGTRGAFIELFGIEVKNSDGSKKDMTTKEAVIAKQTDVMMTNIAGDKYAVGYISLGSLNSAVKALDIDGVKASAENVKNGTYSIARPFNIAAKDEVNTLAKDFIGFILSADGQRIIAKNYIPVSDNASLYVGNKLTGKIVIAGSSSVTPVMEKLKEAYMAINPGVVIEIQQSDSSAGMTGAINGTCDIGMASRELKESELKQLIATKIALDGIAVIVNKENQLTNLTKEQVKSIFTGKTIKWDEVGK